MVHSSSFHVLLFSLGIILTLLKGQRNGEVYGQMSSPSGDTSVPVDPWQTFVTGSSVDDWYVVRVPGDGNCFFYSLLVILRGWALVHNHGKVVHNDEDGVQELRDYFAKHVTIDPNVLREHIGRLTVQTMNWNLFGRHSDQYIEELYKNTRNNLSQPFAWGDERAMKLFSYFTKQSLFVLFGITSPTDSRSGHVTLDWDVHSWDGERNTGSFMRFRKKETLGPPYALLLEQDPRHDELDGRHWSALVHRKFHGKFVQQSVDRGARRSKILETVVPLSTYLRTVKKYKDPKLRQGLTSHIRVGKTSGAATSTQQQKPVKITDTSENTDEPKRIPLDVVTGSSVNDWYVVKIPDNDESLFNAFTISLTGHARLMWAQTNEAEAVASMDDESQLSFRRYFTRQMANQAENDRRALRLLSFISGTPVYVLFPVTSELRDLDWAKIQQEGKANVAMAARFPVQDRLGPPYAVVVEQEELQNSQHLVQTRWHLLVHRSAYFEKFVRKSAQRKPMEGEWQVNYDIGINLAMYLSEFRKKAKLRYEHQKQGLVYSEL